MLQPYAISHNITEKVRIMAYMARYTKIPSGYMGQLVEWPEVITDGKTLDDCRSMLRDALHEMTLAYRDLGKTIPQGIFYIGSNR
jgi:predicted RNase H-like HicB family nuclease